MSLKKEGDFNSIIADTLNLSIHHKSVYLRTLTNVWKGEHPYNHISALEKRMMVIIIGLKMIMPSFWIRHYCEDHNHTKWVFDLYVIFKPIIFLTILMTGQYNSWFFASIVIYFLADLLTYIIGLLVLSDIFVKTPSLKKNLILLGSNYMELVSGFAILYLHFHAIKYIGGPETVGAITAMYYSMSTFTTVGYGDVGPANHIGMILTMAQLTCSIIFIGIILSSYVGKIRLRSE